MQITPHFTLEEFASHDGVAYPQSQDDGGQPWLVTRLQPLCDVLETLRAELGAPPVVILSGYRSPAHNAAVGGAAHSQHMEGRAADITVKGCTPDEVHSALLRLLQAGEVEFGGLGLYDSWVHVDVRQRPSDGHLAQWTGTKVGDEVA